MRNCKDTSDIIEAHHKPITSLAALNTIKVSSFHTILIIS